MINQSRIKQTKEIPALGSEGCGDSGALAMQPQGAGLLKGKDGGARREPHAAGGGAPGRAQGP